MYRCRETLEQKDVERVVNRELLVEPDGMADYVSMGKDGNLYLRRSFWKWFFSDVEAAKITFHSSYDLWNTRNEAEVFITLTFRVIPVWVRYLTIFSVAFVAVWGVLCGIRRLTYLYIRRFRGELTASNVETIYELKLNRRGHLINPFCNCCFLKYENGEDVTDPIMPTIRLKIRNSRLGHGYEIVNYADFADQDRYTIKKKAVTKDNRTFDDAERFAVKDNSGFVFELRIEK